MKLTMLGTGSGSVTECYNTCFVLQNDNGIFLTDCGGGSGIIKQLKDVGLRPTDIHDIFITHRHTDHLTGIIWMMRMICGGLAFGEDIGEYRVYAHKELARVIDALLGLTLEDKLYEMFSTKVKLIALESGDEKNIIGCLVTFFDVGSTKEKQFGYAMLYEGRKLVCLGDEPLHDCERSYVENTDLLMHEAFCVEPEADRFNPFVKHHSTAADACRNAESIGAKKVLLYHTEDTDLPNRKARYTADGRPFFTGEIFVPDDLEVMEI